MSLADRVNALLDPPNSIEAVPDMGPPPRAAPGANPAAPGTPTPTDRAGQPGKALPDTPDPEAIAKRYYVEIERNERRYFEDYRKINLAIRATPTSIRSRREDLATIRAMLDLAAARGWPSVAIKGSASFRREVWIEAEARGLPARGHRPTDPDRQEAERRRSDRGRATPAHPTPPAPMAGADEASPRPVARQARAGLSADGRLVLAALSEKIDRQMHRLTTEAKADLMAFVAAELVKKERAQGPVVLTAEQKRVARAPLQPTRRVTEPETPRRSLSR